MRLSFGKAAHAGYSLDSPERLHLNAQEQILEGCAACCGAGVPKATLTHVAGLSVRTEETIPYLFVKLGAVFHTEEER
jgi:hypothetical protein